MPSDLWPLKCKLDAPGITFPTRILAGGSNEPGGNVTSGCQLNAVGNSRGHDEIGIPAADLRLQAGEEFFFAILPGNIDLHPGHLLSIGAYNQDLQQSIRQIGVADLVLAGELEGHWLGGEQLSWLGAGWRKPMPAGLPQ